MEQSIAEIIVKILKATGYSASYIAKEAGITLATVCNILDGYEVTHTAEQAIRQLYSKLFENKQLEASNDHYQ